MVTDGTFSVPKTRLASTTDNINRIPASHQYHQDMTDIKKKISGVAVNSKEATADLKKDIKADITNVKEVTVRLKKGRGKSTDGTLIGGKARGVSITKKGSTGKCSSNATIS